MKLSPAGKKCGRFPSMRASREKKNVKTSLDAWKASVARSPNPCYEAIASRKKLSWKTFWDAWKAPVARSHKPCDEAMASRKKNVKTSWMLGRCL